MGLFSSLFGVRPQVQAGRALYAAAVDQARRPALYRELGAPDTGEGRFELYTLHVVLLMRRLKRQGPAATETSQALFDAYVRALDDALRDMGVGDLSVGKKMRKLGEAAYGRIRTYDEALDGGDADALAAALRRTVYAGAEAPEAERLAAYVLSAAAHLEAHPLETLLRGSVSWPEVIP
jgi:cytochrome b pre-mRNA-processing protein 3